MIENLEKIESFFNKNLKIKNQIMNLKIDYSYQLKEEDIEKYIRQIYDTLNSIEQDFMKIINDFKLGDYISNLIQNKFNLYKERLLNIGYDFYKLQSFYEKCFYELSDEVINQTKNEIKGYYLFTNITPIINKCNSINELLHVIHYYIINNDKIYQSMPKISNKTNDFKEQINLYGKENDLAYNLFAFFPSDVFVGTTDIVSLENKVLMMIRDVGHATVFEIEEYNNSINVQYYIPKICNVDMVNDLRGINKVTDIDRFGCTSGFFITDRANFLNDMYEIISKIPSDTDIIHNYRSK